MKPPLQRQRKIQQTLIITIIAVDVVALIALILLGYWFNWTWTGFSSKTLWDWLQYLTVAIVTVIAAYLTITFNDRSKRTELSIALANQQETLLQTYLDRISELLLVNHLRESDLSDGVRYIARARTLTVLPRLDASRKRSIIQFLYESNLINTGGNGPFIHLNEADLNGVDLSNLNLSEVNLSRVDLINANLIKANLSGADLTEADFTGANLSEADLTGATLDRVDLEGAIVTKEQLDKAKSSNNIENWHY